MTKFLDNDSMENEFDLPVNQSISLSQKPALDAEEEHAPTKPQELPPISSPLKNKSVTNNQSFQQPAQNNMNKSTVNNSPPLQNSLEQKPINQGPIPFKTEYPESKLDLFLLFSLILTSVLHFIALIMFLFNGTILYQNFWFAIVFCLISVLVVISQFRIEGFRAWAEKNFRLLLRKSGNISFQIIICFIYPYTFTNTVNKAASVVMFVSAVCCAGSIVLWSVKKIKK
ncbi:Hypothetical_protein [Hexamita inflata]|uniref:Hypothetical_protein n=1 Tax=Hexamita inflata TaxID=28002 RepID=A0AA86R2B4_9EUKA|nr:Hypothetical protein HINF_LOCUS48715 [Hexamita inflata]